MCRGNSRCQLFFIRHEIIGMCLCIVSHSEDWIPRRNLQRTSLVVLKDDLHNSIGASLSYPLEVNAALGILKTTGIWRSNYAPFFHRMFWRAGVSIPPPHFASFGFNFVFSGTGFGVVWGLLMWFLVWSQRGTPGVQVVFAWILSGVSFGLLMALYYYIRARKYNLPLWSQIKAAS